MCVLRCCCLCCRSEDAMHKPYHQKMDSSQPLFTQTSVGRSTRTDNAFQSDLKSAIELQKRGTLLKRGSSKIIKPPSAEPSLDLSSNRVSAAFDMNFDDVTAPMAGGGLKANPRHVSKQESTDLDHDDLKGRGSLMKRVTPGGPTPG